MEDSRIDAVLSLEDTGGGDQPLSDSPLKGMDHSSMEVGEKDLPPVISSNHQEEGLAVSLSLSSKEDPCGQGEQGKGSSSGQLS